MVFYIPNGIHEAYTLLGIHLLPSPKALFQSLNSVDDTSWWSFLHSFMVNLFWANSLVPLFS